jgi:hypothetical protein
MTLTVLTLVIGPLALLFFLYIAKGRAGSEDSVEILTSRLQSVDIAAFRNLMDPQEEQYLRLMLPRAEFRKLQRERNETAIEYISSVAQNAAILLRLGEVARRGQERSAIEAGEKLVDTAIRLRLFAFHATVKLYLGMVLPGARIPATRIAEGYEQMTRLVILIGCLEQSNHRVAVEL